MTTAPCGMRVPEGAPGLPPKISQPQSHARPAPKQQPPAKQPRPPAPEKKPLPFAKFRRKG